MHTTISAKLIHITAAALTGAALLLGAGNGAAQAANKIVARVSLSQQTMEVLVDGRPTFAWKGLDRRQGVCHADRLVQADPHAPDVVFEEI
ncbi:exported hypothetical protein [Mesorhizobium metallidurans STM 2683]|uniref:Uncharacterized protein n=1 Tax=Mesorhizobium metallidurans STM 2683 TaxID=1297569 RepID=M5ELE9_9HYPH|nr:exported hypothetical protein [Mesorhizobium metallidurans STM 2683]